jgi:hypothetical protein
MNCTFDDLVSTKLDKSLTHSMMFCNRIFSKKFRLIFLESIKITSSVSSAMPEKVTAFINALIEISQNYNLEKNDFILP